MIRLLFRLIVLVVAVAIVAVALFVFSDRWRGWVPWGGEETPTARTERVPPIDPERAREAGAKIVDTVTTTASRAGELLDEGRLTTKIRAKMQLDDTIDASRVNVDTDGTVVTLRGEVADRRQHQRVLQLARETAGVTSVVDQLTVLER